jgi:hypothetical protein
MNAVHLPPRILWAVRRVLASWRDPVQPHVPRRRVVHGRRLQLVVLWQLLLWLLRLRVLRLRLLELRLLELRLLLLLMLLLLLLLLWLLLLWLLLLLLLPRNLGMQQRSFLLLVEELLLQRC